MSRSASFRLDCRLTGLFYMCLAVSGVVGFLLVRAQLFVAGDPARTLANLLEREALARIGIALELGLALFQALAAVWFAKLFRDADAFAAGALTLFGMVNAVVILSSAAMLGASLDAAHGSAGVDPAISHLLFLMSSRFWDVGNIFFGLWLMPMGWLVWKAAFGHRALGWMLIAGGIGYLLTAFISALAPNAGSWVNYLPIPATIGELWMIGLLLWTGLRGQPH